VPFSITKTDSYMLEFSNLNVRVYKNRAPVVGPVDIATDISISEVWDLKFLQRGDNLFMVHPNHEPHILVRLSDTSWIFTTYVNVPGGLVGTPHIDGPYLNPNTFDDGSISTLAQFTPSALTGLITLTGGSDFTPDWEPSAGPGIHTGRLLRLFHSGGRWTYVRTESRISSSQITATIIGEDLPDLTPISVWAYGEYSAKTGYPTSIAFHQGRLVLGKDETINFSATGELNKFNRTEVDNSLTPENAGSLGIQISLAGKEVNIINRIDSDENGLIVGTEGADWVLAAAEGAVFEVGNISAVPYSSYGNADEEAVRIGKSLITVAITRTKLREARFVDANGGFTVRDIGLLADHLLRPTDEGINSLYRLGYVRKSGLANVPAHQPNPYSRIWMALTNGELISALTSEQEDVEFGPSRIILGGVGDAAGGPPAVLSVATLPSPDGSVSDVWLIVRRYINDTYVNHVEIITQEFDNRVPFDQGVFVDSSISNDSPVHVASVSAGNPAVVTTTAAHGYSTGNQVKLYNIQGVLGPIPVNGVHTITVLSPTTFELDGLNTIGYTGFAAGGSATIGNINLVRKLEPVLTVLSHLEGETVQVVGDGLVQNDQVVIGGVITLEKPAAIIHVGYKYNSDIKLLRFDQGSATGSSFLKTQRTDRVNILVDRMVNMKVGEGFDKLFETRLQKTDEFTGVLSVNTNVGYQLGNQICIRQDTPLPGTVVAVMPKLTTQDR
jgi:hypothetical protein